MRILLTGLLPASNAPTDMTSYQMTRIYTQEDVDGIVINMGSIQTVSSIGIGGFQAESVFLEGVNTLETRTIVLPQDQQIYMTEFSPLTDNLIRIRLDGAQPTKQAGRIELGTSTELLLSPNFNVGLRTTNSSKLGLSGSVYPGSGGYNYSVFRMQMPMRITDPDQILLLTRRIPDMIGGEPVFLDFSVEVDCGSLVLQESAAYCVLDNKPDLSRGNVSGQYHVSTSMTLREVY